MKRALEDVRVYAGLYTGEESAEVLYQEFGESEHVEGVYNYPRFTAGYHYTDEVMWDMYNGIALTGLVHHFIHPDDVISEDRSKGKLWGEMAGRVKGNE